MPVPALERLDRASFDNLIRDPATEQDVVDYAQFTGDLIADTVLEFAAKTRALIPKQRQIGMFFGYILELTGSRMVWAGHLEYERLYRSPDIDFFISPGTYGDRPMGGGSGFMVPNGTRRAQRQGLPARDRPPHADLQRQAGRVRLHRLDGALERPGGDRRRTETRIRPGHHQPDLALVLRHVGRGVQDARKP